MTWVGVVQVEVQRDLWKRKMLGSWQPVRFGEAFSEETGEFSGVVGLVSKLPTSPDDLRSASHTWPLNVLSP